MADASARAQRPVLAPAVAPRSIRVSEVGNSWQTETSDGARNVHGNRADAVQTAILWARLHQPAIVIEVEEGREEVVASFPAHGVR